VSDRYVTPRLESAPAVLGSNAVNSPFSSYLTLLAEVGVVGFVLIVGMYFGALLHAGRTALGTMRRATRTDPLPALALATTVAFFLLVQMAFLENWWETARATVPSWMMLAVCLKEYAARSLARQDP
jgi:O-antigen ligase